VNTPDFWITASPALLLIIIADEDASYHLLIELGSEMIRHEDIAHTLENSEISYSEFHLPQLLE
jgi:hypothetical protein